MNLGEFRKFTKYMSDDFDIVIGTVTKIDDEHTGVLHAPVVSVLQSDDPEHKEICLFDEENLKMFDKEIQSGQLGVENK